MTRKVKCTFVNEEYELFFTVGGLYEADEGAIQDELGIKEGSGGIYHGSNWWLEEGTLTVLRQHGNELSPVVAQFEEVA